MSTPWESGTPLGARYNVLRELGEGGFGRTYLAEDLHRFKEPCVLKEFVPQIEDSNLLAKAQELFEREAKILYQLEHSQIPKFRELMREGGKLFLVQDYVEGPTYRGLLQSRQDYNGHFSETEITQLLYQLLPVLEYIHSLDIIHRDISPENLILRAQDGLPVLIDFGSVKQIAATVEQELSAPSSKTRIGKVGYVPPEQFHSGTVDATSDLYGLAATLVVLATGREPQDLTDMYDNSWNWERFVSLGEPINQVLKQMLAPSPVQRYPSAAAVMQALQGDVAGMMAADNDNDPSVVPVTPPIYVSDNGGAAMGNDVEVYPTTEATQVAAPDPESTTLTSTSISPTRQDGKSSLLQALIGLLVVLGLSSLLMALLFGLGIRRPQWPFGQSPSATDPIQEPVVGLTPDEVARKEALLQRRESLGVNEAWLNQWINQRFYEQYPNLKGRPLTSAVEDAPLRLRWDNEAMDALDTLQLHLSTPARRGLAAYGADDRESWRKTVNRLNVSSRALDDLADAKFATIFPQEQRDDILDEPLGQVWYALAQDSVEDLTSGKTLESVEFETGAFSKRMTGQLASGQGRVFILKLQEGQNLRINLQTPENSTLMSLYLPVPSQKEPFLLSDSSETTWSGQLTQSGYYEIAIVSKSPNPINYALSVAVDNIRNTPKEETTDPPEGDSGEDDTETPTDSETPTNETETPTDNGAGSASEEDNQQGTTEEPSDGVNFGTPSS
ncbi:serine/threonine-protein kinase [Leptothoe spongobia]|uniref:non-specific serine/threonine protein kinase n=1 Tax=Leptothoe spongobia TAU-MAC 1115 TaxID=1967444 RepID=A0A947DG21_9CYAN|nr:serine/threonine-protein kinase [Leptothoe spongobia]MBT9316397.1 serine/threonine protein kinase [Leptothoe spongobia TAU-MAC 1115]